MVRWQKFFIELYTSAAHMPSPRLITPPISKLGSGLRRHAQYLRWWWWRTAPADRALSTFMHRGSANKSCGQLARLPPKDLLPSLLAYLSIHVHILARTHMPACKGWSCTRDVLLPLSPLSTILFAWAYERGRTAWHPRLRVSAVICCYSSILLSLPLI